MLIIDSINRVHTVTDKIRLFLSDKSYINFLSTLKENNLTEEELLAIETSCIVFVDDNKILVCYVKDISGLRLVFLADNSFDFSYLTHKIWSRLELAAKNLGAELIQIEVPVNKVNQLVHTGGFIIENYIFEQSIGSEILPVELETMPIDFNNKNMMQKLAELEFITRINFPSSTLRLNDYFSSLAKDYMTFSTIPNLKGFCIEDDPDKGFVIWWSDLVGKTALGIHVWVSPNYRGNGYGKSLMNSMINQMMQDEITMCSYFISASNIPSIKNALRSKGVLNYFVLNKQLNKFGNET